MFTYPAAPGGGMPGPHRAGSQGVAQKGAETQIGGLANEYRYSVGPASGKGSTALPLAAARTAWLSLRRSFLRAAFVRSHFYISELRRHVSCRLENILCQFQRDLLTF